MKKLLPLVVMSCVATAAFAHGSHDEEMNGWIEHYFKQIDSNGDGMISRDEFMSHASRKFDEMDANHDGSLSKMEVADYKKKERDEWKNHHHMHSHKTGSSHGPVTSEDSKTNDENSGNH